MQRLGLHLTDRCQLDCDHCLRDPGQTARDLPLGLVRRVLAEARDTFAIALVSFTGGEPTLHPEFLAVVDAAAEAGFSWDMVSNGRRFGRLVGELASVPRRRESLRSVTFSLDGATEATHDAIRGQGSYREVLGAVAAAAASGVPFGVQAAIHARNELELEQLGLLAAQLGAKHVSFAWTQPTGTPLDADLQLTEAAWEGALQRIRSLSAALSIDVLAAEGWPTDGAALGCSPLRLETLHIDVEGRLTLCCLHAGVPGEPGSDVAGSVAELGLLGAHRRLLDLVHRQQVARLEAVAGGVLRRPFGRFGCNWCLGALG
ncbi:MAG: radical SAM protein, partial [Deltaproteobacteria bacterium]|nr:radical SAM protein [Deltaproteobacteria bacterium]